MTNSLPKIDLTTFILSISSAAYIGLGIVPASPEGEFKLDLDLARQNIDLLELIYEKTRGNRTPEEDKLLEHLLLECRLKFIEQQREHQATK